MCPAASASVRFLVVDVVGNVAAFIPIGFAVAGSIEGNGGSRLWFATGVGALLSLFIELVQLNIATRATDVDDLIFNTLGAAIGGGVFVAWESWRSESD